MSRKGLWLVAVVIILLAGTGFVFLWSSNEGCWTAACERQKMADNLATQEAVAEARAANWSEAETALRKQVNLVIELSDEVERAADAKATSGMSAVDAQEAEYASFESIYSSSGTGMMLGFRREEEIRNSRIAVLKAKENALQMTIEPREEALLTLKMVRDEEMPLTVVDVAKFREREAKLAASLKKLIASSTQGGLVSPQSSQRFLREQNAARSAFSKRLFAHRLDPSGQPQTR